MPIFSLILGLSDILYQGPLQCPDLCDIILYEEHSDSCVSCCWFLKFIINTPNKYTEERNLNYDFILIIHS